MGKGGFEWWGLQVGCQGGGFYGGSGKTAAFFTVAP